MSAVPTAPAQEERIVRVADWAVEQGHRVIVTLGLGSCVAIMLHDPGAGLGGMAHVLLPSRSLARDATNPVKFPETAVPFLIERLVALGASRARLLAKLAGGAGMFSTLMSPGTIQMGERNAVAARDALRRHAIPLVGESVGGDRGRSVRFYVRDGRVEIRSVGADAAII